MKSIRSEIHIQAPAEKVWAVLMDFNAYGSWNPLITEISGEARKGAKLRVKVRTGERSGMVFRPTILNLEPQKEIRWQGRLLLPGLFSGEHYFRIEQGGGETVRFIHGEHFTGLLVGLMGELLEDARDAFIAMNHALKMRCEQAP